MYNPNAQIFESQIVIRDSVTVTSSTSGGLIVEGGISTLDTYVRGHVAVNDVKITPNLNDIIYEQQVELTNTEEFIDISGLIFRNSLSSAFKASIIVHVNDNPIRKTMWEINAVLINDEWSYNASFTGDPNSGVDFRVLDATLSGDIGIGKIQYTNSNSVQTIVRYRATTSGSEGHDPVLNENIFKEDRVGAFVENALFYAQSENVVGYATGVRYINNMLAVENMSAGNISVTNISAGTLTLQNLVINDSLDIENTLSAQTITTSNLYAGIITSIDTKINDKLVIGEIEGANPYKLYVEGDAYVLGNTTLNGDVTANNLNIRTNLTVIGNTNFAGGITTGAFTVNGNLTANGESTFRNNVNIVNRNFNITGASGSLNVSGSSRLTGTVSINNALNLTGNLSASGTSTLNGTVDINNNLNISNNLSVTGGTSFLGNVTMGNNLLITNTLTVTGGTTLNGSVNINNVLNLNGELEVTGASTLIGAVNINNTLIVTGASTFISGITSGSIYANGSIYASGSISQGSDVRLKRDISTIDSALDKTKGLRGVYYTHRDSDKRSIGVIAQETELVLPEVVKQFGEYKSVEYGNIAGLLIEAIKDLQNKTNIRLKAIEDKLNN
jgi:hypothetical protein